MKLTGLHLLWTHRCIYECDHCFVWGSPRQTGAMTLRDLRRILDAAREPGTIEWIYFEGGESFLYYPVTLRGAREAVAAGFKVGLVSNAYWATDEADAAEWLEPFAGLVRDLSISRDAFHGSETSERRARHAVAAARRLGIPVATIRIAEPEEMRGAGAASLPADAYPLRYRGRAAEQLAGRAEPRPWTELTECHGEDLRDPDRVHVDPDGNLHVCQGITIGNLFEIPLSEICDGYDPDSHPVVGPLLAGGPAELVRRYDLPHAEAYADACHLCYEARCALRTRFPEVLGPDAMYGVPEE